MLNQKSKSILRAKRQSTRNHSSIKRSTLLVAVVFFLIVVVATSFFSWYSMMIWKFAGTGGGGDGNQDVGIFASFTSSRSSSSTGKNTLNFLPAYSSQQERQETLPSPQHTYNHKMTMTTSTRMQLLDGVMDMQDIHQMQKDCPPNRKLWANSSEPFDAFLHQVFVTANNSVHEPFQRPIEEIADRFEHLVKTNRFLTRGFWAEFGVFEGKTLEYASDRIVRAGGGVANDPTRIEKQPQQKSQPQLFQGVMAGFDSFQGLPVSWRKGFPKGDFGGRGKLDIYSMVRSKLPLQVELYKGWFQDTIGIFKDKYPRMPAAVIHHDGDLFLSTAITLQLLADRIVPGTHMIFDELFGYPGYENHEILALYLWMVDHDAELCVMGHKSFINETDYRSKKEQEPFEQSVWFQVLSVKK